MKNQFGILFGLVSALGCAWPGVGLAGSSKSLADCAAMDNVFVRVGCYSEIAVAEGNPDICDQIKDHHLAYANCITQVALSKQDATICDRIDGDHPKALCIIRSERSPATTRTAPASSRAIFARPARRRERLRISKGGSGVGLRFTVYENSER